HRQQGIGHLRVGHQPGHHIGQFGIVIRADIIEFVGDSLGHDFPGYSGGAVRPPLTGDQSTRARGLNQRTSPEYWSTSWSTSRIRANNAMRTISPLSVWRKIARLGLLSRSASSSLASARESRGRGCMIT